MTHKVNERVSIGLYFRPGTEMVDDPSTISDWQEFPASHSNLINSVHISAAASMRLPTLQLVVSDNMQFFEYIKEQNGGTGIADGAHIKISLWYDLEGDPVDRYFRVYNWYRTTNGNLGHAYQFDCYWDSPSYWLQSLKEGIRGTSADALQEIATKCGLQWYASNTSTADEQLWLPANRPMSMFAKSIAAYGYASNTSHMVFGIDSQGFMRYIDVNEKSESDLTTGVALNSVVDDSMPSHVTGTFIAQEFSSKTRAGIMNTLGGYAYTLVEQQLPAPVSTEAFIGDLLGSYESVMDATERSRNPVVAEQIANRSIVDFRPIGAGDATTGNVNPKYETGRAQNYLFSLLNSTSAEFAFHRITDFELGDQFYFKPPVKTVGGEPTEIEPGFEGGFAVSSKTILISGTAYIEKIVAVRNGLGKAA